MTDLILAATAHHDKGSVGAAISVLCMFGIVLVLILGRRR